MVMQYNQALSHHFPEDNVNTDFDNLYEYVYLRQNEDKRKVGLWSLIEVMVGEGVEVGGLWGELKGECGGEELEVVEEEEGKYFIGRGEEGEEFRKEGGGGYLDGLRKIREGDYEGAISVFENMKISEEVPEEGFWDEVERIKRKESLEVARINNIVIANVYLGRVCIEKLEEVICKDPVRFMTEEVVFNLCTMYDLREDAGGSARKKGVLERVMEEYGLGIGKKCFRI
ncbi:hypothetical protein TrST_g2570 [Triparma strigata]|uniref:Uncharacterized protein n=1 Tax=Triparma strigata TaxID=1606541 RepID=A0A9W7EYU1_9STRA|nr:hypothetical protein TrST_g2570 [Triparma strigata]